MKLEFCQLAKEYYEMAESYESEYGDQVCQTIGNSNKNVSKTIESDRDRKTSPRKNNHEKPVKATSGKSNGGDDRSKTPVKIPKKNGGIKEEKKEDNRSRTPVPVKKGIKPPKEDKIEEKKEKPKKDEKKKEEKKEKPKKEEKKKEEAVKEEKLKDKIKAKTTEKKKTEEIKEEDKKKKEEKKKEDKPKKDLKSPIPKKDVKAPVKGKMNHSAIITSNPLNTSIIKENGNGNTAEGNENIPYSTEGNKEAEKRPEEDTNGSITAKFGHESKKEVSEFTNIKSQSENKEELTKKESENKSEETENVTNRENLNNN